MAAKTYFKISQAGVLKNARIGLANLDGDDYVELAPTITVTGLSGITFANESVNATDVVINGTTYPPGTALGFDIIAAADAEIGEGLVVINYETVGGETLTYEKALRVFQRLPAA